MSRFVVVRRSSTGGTLYLCWQTAKTVQTMHGPTDLTEGPAFRSSPKPAFIFDTVAEAEALLARAEASGHMPYLVGESRVEEYIAPVEEERIVIKVPPERCPLPRVPPGWTKEAASFVWGDWLSAVGGFGGYAGMSLPPDPGPGQVYHEIPGARWLTDFELYGEDAVEEGTGEILGGRNLWWETDEDHLRAWAAVGAPVALPQETPAFVHPLATWIATALSSHLAPHASVIGMPGDIGMIRLCLHHCAVDIREDLTAPEVYCAEVLPYLGEPRVCRAPEELRAALDALAVEAER